jgi:transcriptional regulator with XRE-family HTH domain
LKERDLVLKIAGKAFKRLRYQLDITQEQLEEVSDISQKSVTRIEQGKRGPDFYTLYKLRTTSGISIDRLIDETYKTRLEIDSHSDSDLDE